ncbi:hypothetical protein AAMO2058_000058400 [Amorphochlora amoebiformis]
MTFDVSWCRRRAPIVSVLVVSCVFHIHMHPRSRSERKSKRLTASLPTFCDRRFVPAGSLPRFSRLRGGEKAPGRKKGRPSGKKRGDRGGEKGSIESHKRDELELISQQLQNATREGDRGLIRRLMKERDILAKALSEEDRQGGQQEAANPDTDPQKTRKKNRVNKSAAPTEPPNFVPSPSPTPAKKAKTAEARSWSDEKCASFVELGGERRAKAGMYKGNIAIDIREYYKKDEDYLPGVKGISLTPAQWSELKRHVKTIEESLKEKKALELVLKDMRFAQVKEFKGRWFVDIREFWKAKNSEKKAPGKRGIMLRPAEWEALCSGIAEIDKQLKVLDENLNSDAAKLEEDDAQPEL